MNLEAWDDAQHMKEEGFMLELRPWAIRAGPRKDIYWDPAETTAAVVTCGGLCPGLNDVVQSVVMSLEDYGVPEDQICGIRYGLRGFYEKEWKPMVLNTQVVQGIHLRGGTILGTSRGGADIPEIVRRLRLWRVNIVVVIGGNGGNAAAHAIAKECDAQGWTCSVIGVPKSIDNDILIIDKCFGFETAVEEAQRALLTAHTEARSARRGVGIVRLMGRQSGFIAMEASMASGVVDVCLLPEASLRLDSLYQHVSNILEAKGYAVICIAEGAGQEQFAHGGGLGFDKSGNPKLLDTGVCLKDGLKHYFKQLGRSIDVKYIDPSYMIRSTPTIPSDRIYCKVLGANAVHGAFAGFTDVTVGLVNTHYVYLPIDKVIAKPRQVNIKGRAYNRLVSAIKQPDLTQDIAPWSPAATAHFGL